MFKRFPWLWMFLGIVSITIGILMTLADQLVQHHVFYHLLGNHGASEDAIENFWINGVLASSATPIFLSILAAVIASVGGLRSIFGSAKMGQGRSINEIASEVALSNAIARRYKIAAGRGFGVDGVFVTPNNEFSDKKSAQGNESQGNERDQASEKDEIPFEIRHLSAYYSLTLGQAKISFWFSLVAAFVGFMIIASGAALYTQGALVAASVKLVSGVIVDAVAALFFVQSNKAQVSLFAFFEKLRSDRQYSDARAICDEVTSVALKDHLKAILVMQNAGLDPKPMIDAMPLRIERQETTLAKSNS